MGWNKDTDFKVIFTDKAEIQAQQILDYLAYELKNIQAALSVEQDMKDTAAVSVNLSVNPAQGRRISPWTLFELFNAEIMEESKQRRAFQNKIGFTQLTQSKPFPFS